MKCHSTKTGDERLILVASSLLKFLILVVIVLSPISATGEGAQQKECSNDEDSNHLVKSASGWREMSEGQPYPFNTGCDFDVVYLDGVEAQVLIDNNKLPSRYEEWLAREPLLVKRKVYNYEGSSSKNPNELFQNLTGKAYMTGVYGDYLVGVDFPGMAAPPTERWEVMSLNAYLKRFVDGNWNMHKRAKSHTYERYLFGPSDTCSTHTRMTGSPPKDQRASVCHYEMTNYQQLWMVPEVAKENKCITTPPRCLRSLYGLGGPYSGIYFHTHKAVFNEVIHGQKLWLTYSRAKFEKLTRNGAFGKFDDVRNGNVSAAWFISKVLPTLPRNKRPKRCLAEKGDVVYIPLESPHLTMNLGDTLFAATG
jgi:hypothetical protein